MLKKNQAEVLVRITGDCPLIDPGIIDNVINLFKQNNVDYASNVHPPTFPDGLDVEVFSFKTLEKAWQEAQTCRCLLKRARKILSSVGFRDWGIPEDCGYGIRGSSPQGRDGEKIANLPLGPV